MSFRIAILLVLSVCSTANRVNSKIALDVERLEKEETNESTEESGDKMKAGIGLPEPITDTLLDKVMDYKMKEFVDAFYKAANANENHLSEREFQSMVRANECIQTMLEVNESTFSSEDGWSSAYKEIDTDGDGKVSKNELVAVFKNRGAAVMQAADARARLAFKGMQTRTEETELSKTQVRAYIRQHQEERTFLKIGDGVGYIGWEAFFALMRQVKNISGDIRVNDLINVYKRRQMDIYPGECFPVGFSTILGAASPVEESGVAKKVELKVVVPDVHIGGGAVAQFEFCIQVHGALADVAQSSCTKLQQVFWKMDVDRKNEVLIASVDESLDKLDADKKRETMDILRGIGKDPFTFSDLVNKKLESDVADKCKLGY